MIVTPLYAGLLALWFLVLSLRVVGARRSQQISLSDGGDPRMLRLIRAHANFAEYVPLTLVLLGVLELSHFSRYLLHLVGALLLVGRLLHSYAIGFTERFMMGRIIGMLLTFAAILVAALACLYQAVLGLGTT